MDKIPNQVYDTNSSDHQRRHHDVDRHCPRTFRALSTSLSSPVVCAALHL